MRYVIISVVILSLNETAAFCQWTRTSFADTIGVDAMVTQGTNLFIAGGGGGFVPIPLGTKPVDHHDGAASFEGGYNHAHFGNIMSLDSLGTGVFMSSDSGATWESAGLQDTTVFAMAVLGKYLFAAERSGVILRTSDDGAVWDSVASLGSGWLQSLDVDSLSPGKALIFYAAGGPVYMSKDTGTSWVQVSAGIPNEEGGVTCLASNGPDLFAGAFHGYGPINPSDFSGVFRSTDEGAHWKLLDTLFTPQCIAAKGNVVLVGSTGGLVYVSTDTGITWTAEGRGLAFYSVKFAGDNNILAGTSGGIYRSTDNGMRWKPIDTAGVSSASGMLSVTPTDVYAVSGMPDTDLPRLFMGPAGEVVRAPVSGVTPVIEPPRTVPAGYSLSQNYPNPFNPTTVIRYQLPNASNVTLKVYNVLGQEVATLFSGMRTAGVYTATFNAGRFTSGVYFYRIVADGTNGRKFVAVKKLMLIK